MPTPTSSTASPNKSIPDTELIMKWRYLDLFVNNHKECDSQKLRIISLMRSMYQLEITETTPEHIRKIFCSVGHVQHCRSGTPESALPTKSVISLTNFHWIQLLAVLSLFCKSLTLCMFLNSWNSSSQESIQSGWNVAGGGENERRAGFSKVRCS